MKKLEENLIELFVTNKFFSDGEEKKLTPEAKQKIREWGLRKLGKEKSKEKDIDEWKKAHPNRTKWADSIIRKTIIFNKGFNQAIKQAKDNIKS